MQALQQAAAAQEEGTARAEERVRALSQQLAEQRALAEVLERDLHVST